MITCPLPPPAHVQQALDLGRIVEVIASLETGHNWDHPGGALQFTVRSWQEETKLSYRLARNRQAATMVAIARLERYRRICEKYGVAVTAELLIGSWHHGLFGAMSRLKYDHPSSYMRRGLALYRDPTFRP